MSAGATTSHSLLVPIGLEALVVENADLGEWSDLTVDFSRLYQGDILGSQLTPTLFNPRTCPHDPGVHLHWTLPDAMRRGGNRLVQARSMARAQRVLADRSATAMDDTERTRLIQRLLALGRRLTTLVGGATLGAEQTTAIEQLAMAPDKKARKQIAKTVIRIGQQLANVLEHEAGGAPQFPALPNRWLVQRIWREPNAKEISLKAWVVESDYRYRTDGETAVSGAITVPLFGALPLFDYIGKHFDYPGWYEGQEPADRVELTALGYGDPAFTASYSSCKSVFGFHDALDGVTPNTALSYLVVGWYSNPAKDILQGYDLEELGWACSPPPKGESYPTRTLCHGAIYDIQWKRTGGNGEAYKAKRPGLTKDDCTVAIGNTSSEALAALLAKKLDKPSLEPLLSAFIDDALPTTTNYKAMEARLQQSRFASSAGGTQFSIQKNGAAQDPPAPATDATLPQALEQALTSLNALQRDCDRQERELESMRWELQATWNKWAHQYREDHAEPVALTPILEREKSHTQATAQALTDKHTTLDRQYEALATLLFQQFPDLELGKTLTSPWWRPNDPTLLVSAPGLSPSNAQRGGQRGGAQETLLCRVAGQEATTLLVNIPNGQKGVNVSAEQVLKMRDPGLFAEPLAIPQGIQRLLHEALLLDPTHAEAIADQAYRNAGRNAGLQTRLGKEKLLAQVRQWQRTPLSLTGKPPDQPVTCLNGSAPALLALRDWDGNPWLPLFLEWQVSWRPSYQRVEDVLEKWEFVRETDEFRWNGDGQTAYSPQIYQGYSIVSPNTASILEERLKQYSGNTQKKEFETILALVGQMHILAQPLRGLHDAFLMRDQILRPQPINPEIFPSEDAPSPAVTAIPPASPLDPIAALLAGLQNFSLPAPNTPFFPIRAGHLHLLQIGIIDAFGQRVNVPLTQLLRTASLTPSGAPMEPLIQLSPRFSQPARLRVDWIPAENPPETLPANSPICGWIIPNHLDANLLFYDASGTPLGVLQKILRATGTPAAQHEKAFFWVPMPGTSHRPETIHNPELKFVVQWLAGLGADNGAAFWNLLDDAMAKTDPGEPEHDPLLSVLLGRPLALAKASVQLELDGLPATDQRLEKIGTYDSHGFTTITFPMSLGDATETRDGVIGFFVHDTASQISAPLYAAAGAPMLPGLPIAGTIEYKHSHPVLDCETPVRLTVLMDPRAMVHVSTGVLPKRVIELPSQVRSAAKSAQEAFFQVAPLLSPGGDVTMPTPSDDFGKWSWAYRPQVTMWKETDTMTAATDRGGFSPRPQEISEGWLKLKMNPVSILGFWVKEGLQDVAPNTNVTLAWALQGGDRLVLLAGTREDEPLKVWESQPLPGQYGVHIQADTTFTLLLFNKDNSRAERRLSIRLSKGIIHG